MSGGIMAENHPKLGAVLSHLCYLHHFTTRVDLKFSSPVTLCSHGDKLIKHPNYFKGRYQPRICPSLLGWEILVALVFSVSDGTSGQQNRTSRIIEFSLC